MSNANDFVIEQGVLTKYTGPGGNVVIPEGVTEIGEDAFDEGVKLVRFCSPASDNNPDDNLPRDR